MSDILKLMGDLFIPTPWCAFIPAAAFLILWNFVRGQLVGSAAILWALYAILETLNYLRITCSGECNIRIDLLLIYPALLIISLAALAFSVSKLLKKR